MSTPLPCACRVLTDTAGSRGASTTHPVAGCRSSRECCHFYSTLERSEPDEWLSSLNNRHCSYSSHYVRGTRSHSQGYCTSPRRRGVGTRGLQTHKHSRSRHRRWRPSASWFREVGTHARLPHARTLGTHARLPHVRPHTVIWPTIRAHRNWLRRACRRWLLPRQHVYSIGHRTPFGI